MSAKWFILCTLPNAGLADRKFIREPRRGEFSLTERHGLATRYQSRRVVDKHAEAARAKGLQVYPRAV